MQILRLFQTLSALIVLICPILAVQASPNGEYDVRGVLNVTYKKPKQQAVTTVANTDETWVFNSDNTFSNGNLSGRWNKSKHQTIARYDSDNLISHLTDFWSEQGVITSNIRILKNKILIAEVSNGLTLTDDLVYRMDVTESTGVRRVSVSIRGIRSAPNGADENPGLAIIFPTMLSGQAGGSAGSVTSWVRFPFNFEINGSE